VRLSDAPESPYYGGQGSSSGPACSSLNFFVPPPIAIAHHLLRQWAQHEGPWFAPEGQQQQYGGQQQEAAAASEPIPVSSL
jgi:NAD+ diphosphatase